MLNRIESTYLSVLRVVVLVVATIALVGGAISLIAVAPPILRFMGIGAPPPSNTATLGIFIADKRLEDMQSGEGTPAQPAVPDDLQAATRNLMDYLARQGIPKNDQILKAISDDFHNSYDKVPPDLQAGYPASLKTLTEQLLKSKGKPLNGDRIDELVTWHRDHYVADRQADAERKIADGISIAQRLQFAAEAFAGFIMIIFIFLFVKVERSLRIVKTVRVDGDA